LRKFFRVVLYVVSILMIVDGISGWFIPSVPLMGTTQTLFEAHIICQNPAVMGISLLSNSVAGTCTAVALGWSFGWGLLIVGAGWLAVAIFAMKRNRVMTKELGP